MKISDDLIFSVLWTFAVLKLSTSHFLYDLIHKCSCLFCVWERGGFTPIKEEHILSLSLSCRRDMVVSRLVTVAMMSPLALTVFTILMGTIHYLSLLFKRQLKHGTVSKDTMPCLHTSIHSIMLFLEDNYRLVKLTLLPYMVCYYNGCAINRLLVCF